MLCNTLLITHINRVEMLCLYANCLTGTKSNLTDEQITIKIFESFPTYWQEEFELSHGRATTSTRQIIIECFMKKKQIQDRRKEVRKEKENIHEKKRRVMRAKKATGKDDNNIC